MEFVMAMMIAGLFATWIYGLKLEMQELQQRLTAPRRRVLKPMTVHAVVLPEPDETLSLEEELAIVHEPPGPEVEIRLPDIQTPQRGGVRTWILE